VDQALISWRAAPSNSANVSSPHQHPCLQNKYSILQVEDVEIPEINVDTFAKEGLEGRQPIGDKSSSRKPAVGTKSGRNKKTKSNTAIVGDSMIKYISSATNRVTVESFSGASVEDMTDFIKPIVRKKLSHHKTLPYKGYGLEDEGVCASVCLLAVQRSTG
jgi:hypothetical protein